MAKELIERIRSDFGFLIDREDVLAILIFGSATKGIEREKSDIDICIVAPKVKDKVELLLKIYSKVDVVKKNYDVWIFEELPLFMKVEVIENNAIIHTKSLRDLHDYFYSFKKTWKDQARRQVASAKELIKHHLPT